MTIQHLRSSTANKRPTPAAMSDGQLAVNTNTASPGLFFKDSAGALIKVGPVHVGTTAPNASPASGGETGNTVGEQWLDTTGGTYVFKVWDGSAWRSESGTFVDVNGDVMTGALGIIAGSAGSPGLYFSGDTNTGLYSPGADQVAISTGGSGRLFVDASGRVGVGSAPSVGNGIHATINTNNYGTALVLQNANVNGWAAEMQFLGITTTDTQAKIGALATGPGSNSGALAFYTANAGSYLERLRITSAGLVGIGTSSPGRNLHVAGSSATALIESTGSTNADLLIGDGGVRYYGIRGVAGGGSLQIRNDTANTTLATFTSTGLVGIGTTSVQRLLHLHQSADASIKLTNGTTGTGSADGLDITMGGGDGITAYITNREAGAIVVENNGSEAFRVDSSRRLLVGTSTARSNFFGSQSAAFQVEGNLGVGSVGQIISHVYGESAALGGPYFVLGKHRSGSIGGTTLVASNDQLGAVSFTGADGTNFIEGARIQAFVDGTPGANDMPGRLVFSTTADGASSPTERMRITNNGAALHYAATSVVYAASNSAAGTTDALFVGKYGAGDVLGGTNSFNVYTNGNVVNTNNSYGALSDIKLKENIVDASSQWDDIKALRPVNYNFKEGQTHTQIGLVAQEVELVSPGLVSESPDRDEEGNDLGTVTKSVNYSVLYMKAVKALQEAMERIETLEAKVAALESA